MASAEQKVVSDFRILFPELGFYHARDICSLHKISVVYRIMRPLRHAKQITILASF